MQPLILLLTCPTEKEADTIATALLDQRLIACAKKIPVNSRFWWQERIETADEIVLLLESSEGMFATIEAAIRPLHSHETFVLMAISISKTTKGVQRWLDASLRQQVSVAVRPPSS